MKIVLNQNQVGRFNILGNEESLAFSIKIIDGDEGEIVKHDGVKAIARLSTDEDPKWKSEELQDLYDDGEIDHIISQCIEGGRDLDEAKAFMHVYVDNFTELKLSFERDKIEKLKKQIADLQQKLADVKFRPAHFEMADFIKGMAAKERESAERYRKWQADYKEDSPQFADYEKKAAVCDLRAEELDAEYEELWQKAEALFEASQMVTT